jgi:selenocysteine-specific elongation factor
VTTHHFIIATAGHVDHGKSALVKALTGTDPDRLPEEKARGITIDLGFAQLNLAAPNGDIIHAGIVDVPGHEDFVRNMIAGVGSIDLALLVVAVDDGWMPQTEEHLQILCYLGVQRAVIALTKSDLGKIDIVTDQIREQLRDTPFASAQIIPTSVRTGEGIEDLRSALAVELGSTQPQRNFGKPRLFIDRAFTLHGIGTVVTGTLTGGELHRGQTVAVQPQKFEARIRSIQSHSSDLESAQPGMRTAINLPDVEVDQIKRGDVVTVVDLGEASSNLVVRLEKSPRLRWRNLAARPLKSGSSVHLHHGTSRVAARILLFENETLESGKEAIVQLKLESPIFAFLGDRFVIRDASEQHTIAGGIVLDPDGRKHRNFSTLRAFTSDDVDLCVRSEIERLKFVRKETLLRKSQFSANQVADALCRLQHANEIVVRGEIASDAESWEGIRGEAIVLIDKAHECNPGHAGLDLSELRTALHNQAPDEFETLISDLCANDFTRNGSAIARKSHRPSLPADLLPVEATIRALLSTKPFDPPARREIALNQSAKQVLRFLIETGAVVEIGSDVVLLQNNFALMKSGVVDFISENGPATVSELRRQLQSSRRIMVPLLERLDRDGETRRVGDRRTLGQSARLS